MNIEITQTNNLDEILELIKPVKEFYPEHEKWLNEKVKPNIPSEFTIHSLYLDNKLIGTTIIQLNDTKSKICLLFIAENYRKQYFGTQLFVYAIKFIKERNNKILITIPEELYDMWISLLSKSGFVLTNILTDKYRTDSYEFYFNKFT